MKLKTFSALLTIPALSFSLAACSSSGDNGGSEDSGSTESSSENSESVTVTDGYDNEVTLEETPENVVALEWVYAEDLLALGMQPAGIADLDGYNDYLADIEPAPSEDVQDVGTRQEPSLEHIAELEPDLIITAGYRHEGIKEELEEIAPTLMYNPYPAEGEGNQYEEMEATFESIAKAVGEEDKAAQVLNDLDETYDELSTEIEDAGRSDEEVLLSLSYLANENVTFRLFADNSLAAQTMEQIGVDNAYESRQFEEYGYTETSVDALENYQDQTFIDIPTPEGDRGTIEETLNNNEVWNSLSFVQNDNVHRLPSSTWPYGGPLSSEVFAEEVADTLTSEE
ncbi:hypothetical protein CHL76_15215 [Marinococcus halophilus]|uniref:Ferrichrome ABC transporter substrate-binding protein n=1 Tax=Marinococcus halophilus TaxID=1371 RepID=A0A510Y7B4_MARHA|nr:iron-siderophore ABC transporter substrate-binding protein [Marinococcus halophilus]OZT78974.1 hypothetical protein CHL76_15215 [Marinococcus halophilus]GEK58581.1 ferrichrome ABC transporter substrate-binding protein [Marinococcus halophilus]